MVEIINAAYRGEKSSWTSESHLVSGSRTSPAGIEKYMQGEQAWFELMLRDGVVVGTVYLKEESADVLYLGMFAVNPAIQAQGLGKAFLEHVVEKATVENYKKIRLTVIEQRPELISYYERRGYKRTGKREPFPHTDCSEGTPFDENLKVVEMIRPL